MQQLIEALAAFLVRLMQPLTRFLELGHPLLQARAGIPRAPLLLGQACAFGGQPLVLQGELLGALAQRTLAGTQRGQPLARLGALALETLAYLGALFQPSHGALPLLAHFLDGQPRFLVGFGQALELLVDLGAATGQMLKPAGQTIVLDRQLLTRLIQLTLRQPQLLEPLLGLIDKRLGTFAGLLDGRQPLFLLCQGGTCLVQPGTAHQQRIRPISLAPLARPTRA